MPPNCADDRGDQVADRDRVGHVAAERPGVAADLGDLLPRRFSSGLVAVDHRHPRALVGEEVGGGPAHPAGRAGDQRDRALDRPGETG